MIAKKYRKGIEMIRTLGETAIYGGKEYEFLTRSDGTCAIYSNQKKDVDNGFLQIDTNRFMKVIDREELAILPLHSGKCLCVYFPEWLCETETDIE